MPILAGITGFPIKGLQGVPHLNGDLSPGSGLANDRRLALTVDNAVDGSTWHSSRSYLINAVNDNLLKLNLHHSGPYIVLRAEDGSEFEVDPADDASITLFNERLPNLLSTIVDADFKPRLVKLNDPDGPEAHWDFPDSEISIINRNTVAALSREIGEELDIKRFRGNLLVEDLPAWEELGMAGWRFKLGGAEIEVTRPARRCPATAVNPENGERDIPVHELLSKTFGHGFFGMYAEVVKAGQIKCGDNLETIDAAETTPENITGKGVMPYALWPKLALIKAIDRDRMKLQAVGHWPLVSETHGTALKIHQGGGKTIKADLVSTNGEETTVVAPQTEERTFSAGEKIVVSGPYGRQR